LIYRLSRDVEDMLRAKKFPVRVHYGPERLTRMANPGHGVIVFERDRDSGDGVRAIQGTQRNARASRIRDLGVVVTVFAQSSQPGARVNEHEALCDRYVDALIVALDDWFQGAKTGKAHAEFTESRMMRGEELEAEYQQWPGCVYRLRFDLPRGVRDWTYTAEDVRPRGDLPGASQPGALPEGSPEGVSNEAHIARLGGDPDDTEVVEFPGDPPEPPPEEP
jgi:hypothetical protein